jgi:hypothetical protein
MYSCDVYTFYLCPQVWEQAQLDVKWSFQGSALKFLLESSLDIRKVFVEGKFDTWRLELENTRFKGHREVKMIIRLLTY